MPIFWRHEIDLSSLGRQPKPPVYFEVYNMHGSDNHDEITEEEKVSLVNNLKMMSYNFERFSEDVIDAYGLRNVEPTKDKYGTYLIPRPATQVTTVPVTKEHIEKFPDLLRLGVKEGDELVSRRETTF